MWTRPKIEQLLKLLKCCVHCSCSGAYLISLERLETPWGEQPHLAHVAFHAISPPSVPNKCWARIYKWQVFLVRSPGAAGKQTPLLFSIYIKGKKDNRTSASLFSHQKETTGYLLHCFMWLRMVTYTCQMFISFRLRIMWKTQLDCKLCNGRNHDCLMNCWGLDD